jgi:hypothetical protein
LSRRPGLFALAFVSLVAPRALAEDGCPTDGRTAVLLRANEIEPRVAREVADHLRRSLEQRRIAVCTTDDARATASLDLVAGEGTFTLTLRIDERPKTAVREVDVSPIPPDGRPLAVAQAADELLRASWPERFSDAPPAPRPPLDVPREPARPLPEEPAPARGRVHVGLGVGAELFSSGHAQAGPELDVTLAPVTWLGIGARGGMRASASRSATYGEHETTALLGSAGVAYRAALARKVGLDLGPRLHVMRFSFATTPSAGFVARDEDALAVCATAEARAWIVPVEPIQVGLALAVGAPLRAARAVAGGVRVHEIGGLLVGTQVVVGFGW